MAASPSGLKLGLLAQLRDFVVTGTFNRMVDFAYDFPTVVEISQLLTYHSTGKSGGPKPLTADELCMDSTGRVKPRSKQPPKSASTLWKEAIDQVKLGRLDKPIPLNSSGVFFDSPDLQIINSFRIDGAQGGNVRTCDDLRTSLANRSRTAVDPITLLSWGHIAQIPNDLTPVGRALSLGNADESDAYKKSPHALLRCCLGGRYFMRP